MVKKTHLWGLSVLGLGLSCAHAASGDGFVEGSKASLMMRNLYWNNDNRDGAASPSKTEEWAQGFILKYESGYTQGPVGFGVDGLGLLGITLDSGRGRHVGSSMMPSDGDRAAGEWSRLGLTGKARASHTELKYGTLIPKNPMVVPTDSRVLTQTFQGVELNSKDIRNLSFTAGVIEKATGRGSTDRTGLAIVGGTQESDKFYYGGGDYRLMDGLNAQYYVSRLEDYYDQQFFGLIHAWQIDQETSLKTDVRYFITDSTGQNASASGRAQGYIASGYTKNGTGEVDNKTFSIFSTLTHQAHTFTLGYQTVSDGSNFEQLSQGSLPGKDAVGAAVYLYTDRMVFNFTRAGERTAFAYYGFDFAQLGVPGLKASMIYLSGSNIKTAAGGDQKEWERDIALDYVFQSGPLKGLGLGYRTAAARSQAARDTDQNRVIVSYTIPLL